MDMVAFPYDGVQSKVTILVIGEHWLGRVGRLLNVHLCSVALYVNFYGSRFHLTAREEIVMCVRFQMETPAAAHPITPSTDSVFHSLEDSLDDVFYEEPMPTSAVVTAVDEYPSIRQRHNREKASNFSESDGSRFPHPLSAAYYEMPSASDDRCAKYFMLSM